MDKFRELTLVSCPGGGYVLYYFGSVLHTQKGTIHPPVFAGDLDQCLKFIEENIEVNTGG